MRSYPDPGISDFCQKSFNYPNLGVSSDDLIKKIVKTLCISTANQGLIHLISHMIHVCNVEKQPNIKQNYSIDVSNANV